MLKNNINNKIKLSVILKQKKIIFKEEIDYLII